MEISPCIVSEHSVQLLPQGPEKTKVLHTQKNQKPKYSIKNGSRYKLKRNSDYVEFKEKGCTTYPNVCYPRKAVLRENFMALCAYINSSSDLTLAA